MIKLLFIFGTIILFIWPIFIISGNCSRQEEKIEIKNLNDKK